MYGINSGNWIEDDFIEVMDHMRFFVLCLICVVASGVMDRRVVVAQDREIDDLDIVIGVTALAIGAAMMADQDPAPVWEVEAVDRRLNALTVVWLEWVDNVCQLSDEQKQRIGELVFDTHKKVAVKEKRWEIYADDLTEATPVVFGSKGGKGKDFTNAVQRSLEQGEILTKDQKGLLKKASRERRDVQHQAFCGRVVNLYDSRLYLTAEQRQMVLESILKRRVKLTSGFYAFGSRDYLSYEDNEPVTKTISPQLTVDQVLLLEKAADKRDCIYVYGGTPEHQKKRINEQVLEMEEYFRVWTEARGKLYQSYVGGDEKSTEMIDVVVKEIRTRAVENMKKEFFEKHAEMDFSKHTNEGWGKGITLTRQDLDADVQWKEILAKSGLREGMAARERTFQDADVEFRVTLLDDELWLLPEQVIEMRRLVGEHVGGGVGAENTEEDRSLKPFLEMGYMLHLIPESELVGILSSSQMAIWNALKESMPVEDGVIVMQGLKDEIEVGELVEN